MLRWRDGTELWEGLDIVLVLNLFWEEMLVSGATNTQSKQFEHLN